MSGWSGSGGWLAVARGLEREGAYNGAKLVRAALERELIRYAEAEAPSGSAARRRPRHASSRTSPATCRRRSSQGVPAWATPSDAGGTITLARRRRARASAGCAARSCSSATTCRRPVPRARRRGSRSGRACRSGTWSTRSRARSWRRSPSVPATWRPRSPVTTTRTLARAPAPGEWSARETLRHLVYTETLLTGRVDRLLTEDEPDLVAVGRDPGRRRPTRGPRRPTRRHPPWPRATGMLRHETVERLRRCRTTRTGRAAGRHPEWGRVTVLGQAAYFARHEASHLAQLVAAAQGRVPGRR